MVKWVGLGILCGSPSREIGAARLPSMMSGQVGRGDDGKQLSDHRGRSPQILWVIKPASQSHKPSRECLTTAQNPLMVLSVNQPHQAVLSTFSLEQSWGSQVGITLGVESKGS